MARRLALTVALLVAGCASMQQQYNVRRSNVSCDEANRLALRSMRSLGYEVTEFTPAAPGREGHLEGTKAGERGASGTGVVSLRCEGGEVVLSAAADELLKQDMTFSRGFFLTFTSLADHGAENAAWADQKSGGTTGGGVKFKIEPQLALETKLDFGEDLGAANVLAVKVTVENGSDITYQLDPASIELRPSEGQGKVTQIATAAAAAAIARASAAEAGPGAPSPQPCRIEALLRERALAARTLRPGDKAEGFVYFPTGRYARARATLIDTATSESEGFLVEF
jgi:hypothetical protein